MVNATPTALPFSGSTDSTSPAMVARFILTTLSSYSRNSAMLIPPGPPSDDGRAAKWSLHAPIPSVRPRCPSDRDAPAQWRRARYAVESPSAVVAGERSALKNHDSLGTPDSLDTRHLGHSRLHGSARNRNSNSPSGAQRPADTGDTDIDGWTSCASSDSPSMTSPSNKGPTSGTSSSWAKPCSLRKA